MTVHRLLLLFLCFLVGAKCYYDCTVQNLCNQQIGFKTDTGSIMLSSGQQDRIATHIMVTDGSTSECLPNGFNSEGLCVTSAPVPIGFVDITAIDSQHEWVQQSYYLQQQKEDEVSNYINITYPPYGALSHKRLEVGIRTFATEPYEALQFTVTGLSSHNLVPDTAVIESKVDDIDPSSFFFDIHTTAQVNGTTSNGPKSRGYIEFVLPDEDLPKHRRYVSHTTAAPIQQPPHQTEHLASSSKKQHAPINICIFGADIMDGQRRIWLLQSEHMDRRRFQFTWILGAAEVHSDNFNVNNTARHVLTHIGIDIIDSPTFPIEAAELFIDPGDGRPPAAQVWGNNVENLFKYAHESLVHYNYVIDDVQPLWCRRIYQKMRQTLLHRPCEILVYGNTRLKDNDYSGDVLITDTAKALNIPTVAELMNLYVSKDIVPTVIVAPSTYAVEHESIQAVLTAPSVPMVHNTGAQHQTTAHARVKPPRAVVIPPSVDTDKFDPARFKHIKHTNSVEGAVYRHPGCLVSGQVLSPTGAGDTSTGAGATGAGASNFPCVVVGFLARLSPEKNPGLFLQAAHEILQRHPFARFTVVGDGALRASLEDLAARLQISWAVHFAGWVSAEELPQLLAGLDIVINTSLRAWSETFCISNIEVMSMEVPLVTFAVGGIGEYVQDHQLSTSAGSNSTAAGTDYSVSSNAVVVNRASPSALASAVQHLILHPALRRSLGRAGRQTVLSYFTVDRQMLQYAALYTSLYEHG